MGMKRVFAFALVVLLLLCLNGCKKTNSDENRTVDEAPEIKASDIAIVCGYHSNAPVPALNDSELARAIEYSVRQCGSVTVIVNDGDPFAALDFTITASEVKEMSKARQEQFFEDIISDTQSVLAGAVAVTPEVDTLEAIRQAARGLSDEESDKCMYILDSGLSTKGDLNVLADNLMRLNDVTPIVETLLEEYALPDLTGIYIVWIGLGDTADEQEDLTSQNRQILKELWEAVLTAAGAEVKFIARPTGQNAEKKVKLPEVTAIPIVQEKNIVPDGIGQVKPRFQPDSDEFIDAEEARAQLLPVADYLLEHPDYLVILAGTTATVGTNESCKALSLKRAEAVRLLLIEMGVSEGQIQRTVGLGYQHEFHVQDLNADGSLNENNAQENRAVLVVGVNSEAAQILANY